ncbi:MAG: hypothetical protein EU530_08290 [Promethearchaeota archaeon]|nr:MAG: hypothetical protein EU530_08290 [Candidatus Lokiarchaeota archaeon]
MASKIVHTELDDKIALRFDLIKSHLGLKNDGEVIRFLISNFYTDKIDERYSKKRRDAKDEYEKEIKPMLEDFMDKYGDQWRRLGEDE